MEDKNSKYSTTFFTYDNNHLSQIEKKQFRNSINSSRGKERKKDSIEVKNPPISSDCIQSYKWGLSLS